MVLIDGGSEPVQRERLWISVMGWHLQARWKYMQEPMTTFRCSHHWWSQRERNQKPEETRLIWSRKNAKIMRSDCRWGSKSGIFSVFYWSFPTRWTHPRPILRWRNRAIPRTESSAPEPFWMPEDCGWAFGEHLGVDSRSAACLVIIGESTGTGTGKHGAMPPNGGLKIVIFLRAARTF